MTARNLVPLLFTLTLVALGPSAAHAVGKTPRMRIRSPYNPNAKKLKSGPLLTLKREMHRYGISSQQTDKLVTSRQYNDLSGASIEIMRRYVPHEHLIVGMGRDPAPLVAFLQNVDPRLAKNFPANGDGFGLTYEQVKPFLKKLLPKKFIGGRKLVLMDQTASGKTLHGYAKFFVQYVQELGLDNEVIKLALYKRKPSQMRNGLQHIDTTAWPDVDEYRSPSGPYENTISEYPKIHLFRDKPKDLTARPEYDEYRKAVYKRMEHDRKLDAFLTEYKNTTYHQLRDDSRSVQWGLKSPFQPMEKKQVKGSQLELERHIVQKVELLRPEDYRSYSWGVQRLFEQFPAQKGQLYVGVGVTATPLTALIERLDPSRVAYLPIDNARISAKHEQAVAGQVKAFLPATKLNNTTRIVLFQRGSGKALSVLKQQVEQALAQAGRTIKVEAVALHDRKTPQGVERIDIRGQQPLLALDSPDMELIAPFKHHVVDGKYLATKGVVRANYRAFKKALEPMMKTDADLDAMLRGAATHAQQ